MSREETVNEEKMVNLMKREGLSLCYMWMAARGDVCVCVCVYKAVSEIHPHDCVDSLWP